VTANTAGKQNGGFIRVSNVYMSSWTVHTLSCGSSCPLCTIALFVYNPIVKTRISFFSPTYALILRWQSYDKTNKQITMHSTTEAGGHLDDILCQKPGSKMPWTVSLPFPTPLKYWASQPPFFLCLLYSITICILCPPAKYGTYPFICSHRLVVWQC